MGVQLLVKPNSSTVSAAELDILRPLAEKYVPDVTIYATPVEDGRFAIGFQGTSGFIFFQRFLADIRGRSLLLPRAS